MISCSIVSFDLLQSNIVNELSNIEHTVIQFVHVYLIIQYRLGDYMNINTCGYKFEKHLFELWCT